jgi:uncharacterized membrane protein
MKLPPPYAVSLTILLTFLITLTACFVVHALCISLGVYKTLPGIIVCICGLPNNFLLARNLINRFVE